MAERHEDRRAGPRGVRAMPGKGLFDRYCLRPAERPTSEIRYHYDTAPGRRYLLVDRRLVPEADLYVIERRVGPEVGADQEPYVDPHVHNCTSFYIFRGSEEDPESLAVEVRLGEEVRVLRSPCQVFIPAGLVHTLRVVGGPGWFIHVVLKGDYNESLA